MSRFGFFFAFLASLSLPASATPQELPHKQQPVKSDFHLELSVAEHDYRVLDNKYPLVNVRVRYTGQGEVQVAPLSFASAIQLSTPGGWQAKKPGTMLEFMGHPGTAHLKDGGYTEGIVPLESRFARIVTGSTTMRVRVKVQPYIGEWNILDLATHPDHKFTLKPLKPILLKGDVTVTIPTSKSTP